MKDAEGLLFVPDVALHLLTDQVKNDISGVEKKKRKRRRNRLKRNSPTLVFPANWQQKQIRSKG
jgi:hypothetical protein